MEIWFGIAHWQISSNFDRVICQQFDNGRVLSSFHVFILYMSLSQFKYHKGALAGDGVGVVRPEFILFHNTFMCISVQMVWIRGQGGACRVAVIFQLFQNMVMVHIK